MQFSYGEGMHNSPVTRMALPLRFWLRTRNRIRPPNAAGAAQQHKRCIIYAFYVDRSKGSPAVPDTKIRVLCMRLAHFFPLTS